MCTHRPINISLIEGIRHGMSELDNYDSMILTPQGFAYTHTLTFNSVFMWTNMAAKAISLPVKIGYASLMCSTSQNKVQSLDKS